ncbi:16S rRNA (guanine(966)-N(2))-methyltransferase RsmD [archaeon]|nr:MAG: 16S rRNA (guanine(966)-N(2))-methyltransferase RsmD [archaeon]
MRITGGAKRGQRLVPWENAGIRPMRDFVRTAIFNILNDLVPNCCFLDLFSGTGSVGLEALSRGAASAFFVDRSIAACAIARQNLTLLGFLDKGHVLHADFADGVKQLEERGCKFDLLFVGPPYGKGLAELALSKLGTSSILIPEAIVVTEVYKKKEMNNCYGNLKLFDRRVYGDNLLLFYDTVDKEDLCLQSLNE